MLIMEKATRVCVCVCVVGEVRDILEISVPPSQFCCKPKLIKISLKIYM